MIDLIFDTETTGFPSVHNPPEIVQIAAILQDRKDKRILAEMNVIVKPNKPIPDATTAIHGITDELASDFGMSQTQAESIFTWMVQSANRVIAHNIAFDLSIVKGTWPIAYQFLEQREHYCTMLEAAKIDIPKQHAGKSRWPKLDDCYRYFFDKSLDGAHDAMVDTRGCRDVYLKLIEKK